MSQPFVTPRVVAPPARCSSHDVADCFRTYRPVTSARGVCVTAREEISAALSEALDYATSLSSRDPYVA
jgi:hypothetical protein